MVYVSEHFTDDEFRCKCCGGLPSASRLKKLVDRAERIRSVCGNAPMIIHCAYRCERHNAEVGGVKGSYHIQGMALDFEIAKKKPAEVFRLVSADPIPSRGGIGLYKTFVHSDSGSKRRWNELS